MNRLLLLLCLFAQIGFAQITPRIDSLKRELDRLNKLPDGYGKDTLQFQTLKAVMRSYADINIDSSLYYNGLLIKLCGSPNLQKELIYGYQFTGYLHQVRGDYHQSIRFHYKALPLAQQLKQYTRTAASYGWLAHAYNSLHEYDKASELCKKGLAVLRSHPDTTTQLSILNVYGAMYRGQKRFSDALTVNQTMYQLAQQTGNTWFEAQGMHTIGWDYMELGNLTEPLPYFEKALALAREIGSADLEVSILPHIAELYRRQRKWTQALAYGNLAKQTAIRLKNSSILAESNEKLYQIYKQTGASDKALKAHEDFVFLKDSLSKETNQHRTEALNAEYDNIQKTNALQTERITRQAEQNYNQQIRNGLFLGIAAIIVVALLLLWNNRRLEAKNREIDRQRALVELARGQLAESNQTLETRVEQRTKELVRANQELIRKNEEIKTALFKGQTIERKRVALELHDNLSSLLSAVNMSVQAINPHNLSEPEQAVYRNVRQLIQNAYTEVRNISHNILPAELEREGLAVTLTTLINRLNQGSMVQFSITITGLLERLPVQIEFNIYSIVLELINNTIKHAQATTVAISLFKTDLGVNLSVTDDGIGLPQTPAKDGIGFQNIQARLDSMGGTFNTLAPAEKGLRVVIKIPIEVVSLDGNGRAA
jgi:two-component system, NarL family, sensor histidine kinase LiaS